MVTELASMNPKENIPKKTDLEKWTGDIMDYAQSISELGSNDVFEINPDVYNSFNNELTTMQQDEIIRELINNNYWTTVLLLVTNERTAVFDLNIFPEWKSLFPSIHTSKELYIELNAYLQNTGIFNELSGAIWAKWAPELGIDGIKKWSKSQATLEGKLRLVKTLIRLSRFGSSTNGVVQNMLTELTAHELEEDETQTVVTAESIVDLYKLVPDILDQNQADHVVKSYTNPAHPSLFLNIYSPYKQSAREARSCLSTELKQIIEESLIITPGTNVFSNLKREILISYIEGTTNFSEKNRERVLVKLADSIDLIEGMWNSKLPMRARQQLFASNIRRIRAQSTLDFSIHISNLIEGGEEEEVDKSDRAKALIDIIEAIFADPKPNHKELFAALATAPMHTTLRSLANGDEVDEAMVDHNPNHDVVSSIVIEKAFAQGEEFFLGNDIEKYCEGLRRQLLNGAIQQGQYQIIEKYLKILELEQIWEIRAIEGEIVRKTAAETLIENGDPAGLYLIPKILELGVTVPQRFAEARQYEYAVNNLPISEMWRLVQLSNITNADRTTLVSKFWKSIEIFEKTQKLIPYDFRNTSLTLDTIGSQIAVLLVGDQESVEANEKKAIAGERLRSICSVFGSVDVALYIIKNAIQYVDIPPMLAKNALLSVGSHKSGETTKTQHLFQNKDTIALLNLSETEKYHFLVNNNVALTDDLFLYADSELNINSESTVWYYCLDMIIEQKDIKSLLDSGVLGKISTLGKEKKQKVAKLLRTIPERTWKSKFNDKKMEKAVTALMEFDSELATELIEIMLKYVSFSQAISISKGVDTANILVGQKMPVRNIFELWLKKRSYYEQTLYSAIVISDDIVTNTEQINGINREWKKTLAKFERIVGNKIKLFLTLAILQIERGMSRDQLVSRLNSQINRWMALLESLPIQNLPFESQLTNGLEYEATISCARGFLSKMNVPVNLNSVDAVEMVSEAITKTLRDHAGLGLGMDSVYEIATKAGIHPYVTLLEMYLLGEAGLVNFNFQGYGYKDAARGIHATFGALDGFPVCNETRCIQNMVIMANWAGVNAGAEIGTAGHFNALIKEKVGENEHDRLQRLYPNQAKWIPVATEFRALSVDSVESFERMYEFMYLAGMGATTVIRIFGEGLITQLLFEDDNSTDRPDYKLRPKEKVMKIVNAKIKKAKNALDQKIAKEYIELLYEVSSTIEDHNKNFFERETLGYIKPDGTMVEPHDFNGEHNYKRMVGEALRELERKYGKIPETIGASTSENPNHEQIKNFILEQSKIAPHHIFDETNTTFINTCTFIQNLFLKSTTGERLNGRTGEVVTNARIGDNINARAVIATTKLPETGEVEEIGFLPAQLSMFDRVHERQGYYVTQGASPEFLTHKVQTLMLEYRNNMRTLIHNQEKSTF